MLHIQTGFGHAPHGACGLKSAIAGSIHDEPDVCFDTTGFYVGFVSSKYFSRLVIVVVNEGFDTDGCCFTVVGYMLVRDADVVEVFESL